MTRKQIKTALTKWTTKHFPAAFSTKIDQNDFGDWRVTVEHDEDGYFVEEHTFAALDGKLRYTGLTIIEY